MITPSKAALYFGIWEIVSGVLIALAPEFMSGLLGFTPTDSPWVRVIGIILIEVGLLYVIMGLKDAKEMYEISAYSRILSGIFYTILVVLTIAQLPMLLFAALDIVTGGHMWALLRRKKSAV